MSTNFTAVRPGAVQAVTGQNQNIDLAALLNLDAAVVAAASDVLLDNFGPFDAYILFGGPNDAVTTQNGVRIPAGSVVPYGKGNALRLAVIGDGATSLKVHLGTGA